MSMVGWKKDELRITESGGGAPCRTTLAAVESLAVPLVQEVVFLADFRCEMCQKRVAEIMSKMNGVTQSVVVSIVDKRVTLTCTYPTADKLPARQVASGRQSKVSPIMRLFRSSFR